MIHLLQPAIPVLVVQLYWLSIVIIGWVLVRCLLSLSKSRFAHKWPDLPLAAKFLIAAATSFTLFGIFTVIGYLFKLPPWWLGLSYGMALALTFVYCVANFSKIRKAILPTTKSLWTGYRTIGILSPFSLMLALVVIDLVINFFIGSFIGADGFVHVSKIRHLSTSGFTLTDAYYGTVPETRHTISVTHTLMAVPSWFGINPIVSWYASGAFLKLVKLSAIFYLGWRLLSWMKHKLRMNFASLIVIFSLGLFNNYFNSYPSLFAATWIILLIIALLDVVDGHNIAILLIACALIALTHPITALAVAILMGLVFFLLLVFDRQTLDKRKIWGFIIGFVLLASTPIFAATLPNRMTDNVKNYGVNQSIFYSIGSHQAFKPSISKYFAIDAFTAIPELVVVLLFIGIAGLFIVNKKRPYRIIIASIVLYVPLVLYNPIAFSLLRRLLPDWGLARFGIVNQLTLSFGFFGLFIIFLTINKFFSAKIIRFSVPVLTVATAIIFIFTQSFGSVDPRNDRGASMYQQQKTTYGNLADITQVLPNDKNAIVFAERTNDSFMIPVVAQLRVVAINEFNSTPAADMQDRLICSDLLYYNLQSDMLKQVGVSYVLTQRQDTNFYGRALKNPQLTPVKENDRWVLFKFNGSGIEPAHQPVCIFNES